MPIDSSIDIEFIGEKVKDRKYIALIHGRTKIFARKHNVEKIRRWIRIARAYGARVVVLPPYFNTGPVLEYTDLSKRRYVKRLFEQVKDHSIQVMRGLALTEAVSIIIPAFLEKAGSHYYVSSLFIGRDGSIKCRNKKMVISNIEDYYNIVTGKEVNVFKTRVGSIGVIINEEILYPEIFRMYLLKGCTLYVITLNPLSYKYTYITYVARSRVSENGLPVIIQGNIIEYHSNVEGGAPSVIYNCDNNKLFEYNGVWPKIIMINPDSLCTNDDVNKSRIKYLGRVLAKTVKEAGNLRLHV